MDANFGPDVSEDGAGKPESSKNKVVVAAVAIGALVGLGVGVGAFGMAAAMQDGHLFSASSDELITPTTTETTASEERPEPTLVRETETTTQSPTPTTVTSTMVHEAGSSTSPADTRDDSDDERRTSTDGEDRRVLPSVVPEQVLRPITTTSTPSSERDAGDGDDSEPATPSTSTTVTSPDNPDDADDDRASATQTTSGANERDGEDKEDSRDESDRPSQVPTDGSENPSQPVYPSDATNAELEAQLRLATSNSTPNEERVRRFEQGRTAQPVINMMTTLTSGSVSPISWEFVGPVRVTEGRAETRMRIFTPFPIERPAIFVWKDSEWKISRETTCELAKAMYMGCPA